jgi:hypothetical protein
VSSNVVSLVYYFVLILASFTDAAWDHNSFLSDIENNTQLLILPLIGVTRGSSLLLEDSLDTKDILCGLTFYGTSQTVKRARTWLVKTGGECDKNPF